MNSEILDYLEQDIGDFCYFIEDARDEINDLQLIDWKLFLGRWNSFSENLKENLSATCDQLEQDKLIELLRVSLMGNDRTDEEVSFLTIMSIQRNLLPVELVIPVKQFLIKLYQSSENVTPIQHAAKLMGVELENIT